jgi:hypothetical protein
MFHYNNQYQYSDMDTYISNLQSDITSIKDFEKELYGDQDKGYDVGTSLDTLGFQKDSLTIDHDFFVHMKDVYIKKLYGDLYKYCDSIIENALAIEEIPNGFTRESIKTRKFRGMKPYPPPNIPNPLATNDAGEPVEGEPAEISDPTAKYDMNEIFAVGSDISAGSPSTGSPASFVANGFGILGGGYGFIPLNFLVLILSRVNPFGISSIAKAFSIIESQYLYKSP